MIWNVVGGIASILLIVGAVIGFIRWSHDRLVESVKREIRPVRDEVTHNSGTSLKDLVVRTREELEIHKQDTTMGFKRVENHLRRQDRHLAKLDDEVNADR